MSSCIFLTNVAGVFLIFLVLVVTFLLLLLAMLSVSILPYHVAPTSHHLFFLHFSPASIPDVTWLICGLNDRAGLHQAFGDFSIEVTHFFLFLGFFLLRNGPLSS